MFKGDCKAARAAGAASAAPSSDNDDDDRQNDRGNNGGGYDDVPDIHRPLTYPTMTAIRCVTAAQTQAIAHCQATTPSAQPLPSSRRIDAIAATQGV